MGMDPETDKMSAPSLDGDASNLEFTQANLIGLFLTLSLCLLTQPWGSLLYRPLEKDWPKIARILFFVWRLHPIACVAETIIILVCYIDTILETRRRCIAAQRRIRLSEILDSLHISSTALLLIRANDDRDGPVEVLLEDNISLASSTAGAIEDSEPGEELDSMAITTQSGAATSGDPTQPLGLLRRRTTQLESAIPLIDGSNVGQGTANTPSHTSALERALNTAVLGHKEKWLDIIATFSALIIML